MLVGPHFSPPAGRPRVARLTVLRANDHRRKRKSEEWKSALLSISAVCSTLDLRDLWNHDLCCF
jgi:hypothetical protein